MEMKIARFKILESVKLEGMAKENSKRKEYRK